MWVTVVATLAEFGLIAGACYVVKWRRARQHKAPE
jgi:hypothetical protein